MTIAQSLDLACLVEVHTTEELDIALQADAEIIGINNRDLTVFKTDLATTFRLTQKIPQDKIVISEIGLDPLFGFSGGPISLLKLLDRKLIGEAFNRRIENAFTGN